MVKKWSDLSDEQKERKRVRTRAASKKRKAERAIAAGRVPGVVGGPRKLSDDERAEHQRANAVRFRDKHRDRVRASDAERKRAERRERAAAKGLPLLKPGQRHSVLALSDEEKLARKKSRYGQYRRNHPEKDRACQRRTYLASKEKVNERSKLRLKKFKAEKPDEFRARRAAVDGKRRARKKGGGGSFTHKDVEWLWRHQKGKCVFCLLPLVRGKFHVDHHVPLARGGSNDRKNLRLLHKKCNLQKSWRDPIDHALENGMLFW